MLDKGDIAIVRLSELPAKMLEKYTGNQLGTKELCEQLALCSALLLQSSMG